MSPSPILIAVPKPARVVRSRAPMRRVNSRRRQIRHARDFGDLAVFVRTLPCLVEGCAGEVEAAHVRSRGAGGNAWIEVDGERVGNIVPLCHAHHQEQHHRGQATFHGRHTLRVVWRNGASLSVSTMTDAARTIGHCFKGPEER